MKGEEKYKVDFLLGNEAIARGAIEAHVDFVAGYPGTPSSEIIESLCKEAGKHDIHVEWSTNEQVAFERALGASLAGRRSMVTMKHAGFNWIVDPLSVAVMSGIHGGLVIVTADDPGCHTSANEQDNRFYGLFLRILTLEPWDPKSAKDFTLAAFALSEKIQLPIILRSVTRVSHSRSDVVLNPYPPRSVRPPAKRDPKRFFVTGARSLQASCWLIEQQPLLEKVSDELAFNTFDWQGHESLCIITSGVAATYVEDVLQDLDAGQVALMKLGCVYPIPKTLLGKALSAPWTIMIVEEGSPVVETQIRAIAGGSGAPARILGKLTGHLPQWGELNSALVSDVIYRLLCRNTPSHPVPDELMDEVRSILPNRSMVFCAGCPHTGTMYALKTAMKRSRVQPFIGGDIGCYTLMFYPPHHLGDAKFSMGSSIGVASGYSQALKEKAVAVIGDSTFIHAGIPGLINCIYNDSDILVIICDNNTTGMTGGQPHAGTGVTATGKKTRSLDLESLVRGCGVESVEVVDPYKIRKATTAIRRGLKQKGVYVIISRRVCALQAVRKQSSSKETPIFRIDPEACKQCLICIEKLACPALFREEGEKETVRIDSIQCTGCGMCAQICPSSAISSSI